MILPLRLISSYLHARGPISAPEIGKYVNSYANQCVADTEIDFVLVLS